MFFEWRPGGSLRERPATWAVAWIILASVSVALSAPAVAQEGQTGEEDVLGIEEITVTARKREESLQDAPISITAFSERSLRERGINDMSDLGEHTPNLVFDHTTKIAATSSAAAIYIRGIGQDDWALPVDPGVGLYLDGVYIARTIGGVMDVLEVERIEVLKGPQGTLFGRNTIGGAISVTTKKPDPSEFFGNMEFTIGRFDRTDLRVYVNVPLAKNLAFSLAGSRKNRDGFVKNVLPGGPDLGNEDAWSGRAAIHWEPNSRLTVDISADYTRERESPAPFVLLDVEESGRLVVDKNGNGLFDPLDGDVFIPALFARLANGAPFLDLDGVDFDGDGSPFNPDGTTDPGEFGPVAGPGLFDVFAPFDRTGFPQPAAVCSDFFDPVREVPGGFLSPGNSLVHDLDPNMIPGVSGAANINNPRFAPPPPGIGGVPNIGNPARFDPANNCFNDRFVLGPFRTASTHTTPNAFVNNFPDIGRPQSPDTALTLWGISGDITFEAADWLTIKSITAFRSVWGFWARDIDHSPLLFLQTSNDYEQDQFSQEFQFLGTNLEGRLNWILGLYYFTEDGCHVDLVELPGAVFDSGGCIDNRNFAAFGQATYDVTDKLHITAGFRWTDDKKKFLPDSLIAQNNGLFPPSLLPLGVIPQGNPPAFAFVLPRIITSGTPGVGEVLLKCSSNVEEAVGCITVSEVDPLANITYNWTDDIMTYFTYSQGFKAGTFTQRVFPQRPDVPVARPEKVEVFELGFKTNLLQRRVRFNGAFFHTNYTDLQVNVFERTRPDADPLEIGIITRNAAAAKINGFELELVALVTSRMTFEAGVGYLDADYTRIEAEAAAAGLTLNNLLVNAPKWSINISGTYAIDLGNNWLLVPRFDYSYTAKTANDSQNTPLLVQDGYSILNLSARIQDPDRVWEISFGAHNVTNTIYLVAGDASQEGTTEGSFGRPREWFMSVRRTF